VAVSRSGTISVAGRTFTLIQSGCSVSLKSTGLSNVSASGGSGSFSVSGSGGCEWQATSNASWINITSGGQGVDNDTVSFTIAPNVGPARTGTITAGGQTFTISQIGGCSYTLSSSSILSPSSGTTGSLSIGAETGCTWTATSNNPWITVTSGATGSGNGNIGFSVDASTAPLRVGTITAGNQTFTIVQESGCAASFSLTSANLPATGGVGGFNLTINSQCTWTASSSYDWITVTSGSGTGNGPVAFQVASNIGAARTGTITAGGQAFTVNQSAAPMGSIAGTLRYFFGQSPIAVPGVTLSASGSQNVLGSSGSNGSFSITGFGSGAYTLTPSKTR